MTNHLDNILRTLRFEGSVFFNAVLDAPWDLPLDASACPRIHVVVEGECWITLGADRDRIHLRDGDIIVLNDGCAHRLAHLGPTATSTVSSGASRTQRCRLVCGRIGLDAQAMHPFMHMLPAQLRASGREGALADLLRVMEAETRDARPGTQIIVDRLCEALFLTVLRDSGDPGEAHPAPFAAAIRDRVIGEALRLIHENPEVHWTIDKLARAAGLSRAPFARRFHELVGIPPMRYLSLWRMKTAEVMLQDPTASVGTVSARVGFSSPASFARAFRNHFRRSPRSD